MTRAKFKCESVLVTAESKTVTLTPVVSGSPENKDFYKWTPGGKITLEHINPNVVFIPGKEYYVDFSEAV